MKRISPYLSIATFAISLAITILARKAGPATDGGVAVLTAAPPSLPGKTHREQSAFEEVKSFLRAGDLAGAKASLRRLAERDPVAFFELLERLPGIPGIEDTIRDAAARLPWNDPEITSLLNRIGTDSWRDLAWDSYTAPQIGLRPDEEVFEVGMKARNRVHLTGVRKLMEDAAAKRPDEFLAYLNRLGGTSIREEFFEMLIKHHPQRVGELFATIPDGSPGANYDRAYVLQVRARCLPTAENLLATLADTGSRGTFSGELAALFSYQTYRSATPGEKEKVLAAIAEQPPLARNRMLAGLFFDEKPLPLDEFNRVTALYTSGSLQQEVLEQWIESQPDLSPDQRDWIARLPTERMRSKANELLDARAASRNNK